MVAGVTWDRIVEGLVVSLRDVYMEFCKIISEQLLVLYAHIRAILHTYVCFLRIALTPQSPTHVGVIYTHAWIYTVH